MLVKQRRSISTVTSLTLSTVAFAVALASKPSSLPHLQLQSGWFAQPFCRSSSNEQSRSRRSRRNMLSAINTDNHVEIPPLRYLGDKNLMEAQPLVTKAQLQSDEFQSKLKMLPKAMKQYGGIGIAAPQIGWWTRVFCFGIEGFNPRYPNASSDLPLTIWINPVITWKSEETNWMWEGCLSVPGMRGWVERPAEVKLSGWDESGEEKEQHLKGLAARVAQHELDHLDGVLFPHRVPGKEFLVPQASMDARSGWAENWPSFGSYKTAMGELCEER